MRERSLTRSQFDAIQKKLKREGRLTASGIVEEASNPNSPLHVLFEWDDTQAAKQYRLSQARTIIKRANISIQEPGSRIVHVPSVQVNEGGSREGYYAFARVVVRNDDDFQLAYTESLRYLTSAERAVETLRSVMKGKKDNRSQPVAIALDALRTCREALAKIA